MKDVEGWPVALFGRGWWCGKQGGCLKQTGGKSSLRLSEPITGDTNGSHREQYAYLWNAQIDLIALIDVCVSRKPLLRKDRYGSLSEAAPSKWLLT
jgi:hypothetical protein